MTKNFPLPPPLFSGPALRLLRGTLRLVAVLFLSVFFISPSFAHNPLSSWAMVRLHPDHLEMKVELAADSAWLLLGETLATEPQVEQELPRLRAKAGEVYRLSFNGKILTPRETGVDFLLDDAVEFRLIFARPDAGPLRCEASYLRSLPDDHQTILTLLDENGRNVRSEVLNAAKASVILMLPAPGTPTWPALAATDPSTGTSLALPVASASTVSFRDFLLLGIEHILTGYDHLLFLCGLLIACRRPQSMVVIVTCFTLAHSITLALAALNVVTIPGRIVEPLIAATIVFVGVENLLRREEPPGRWLLTFGFGLIHGFGFAGALREAGLGSSGGALAVPLFAFNLGVELGQLAVIGLLLPVYLKMRDRPAFARLGRPAISALVVLAGGWWLVQRTLLA